MFVVTEADDSRVVAYYAWCMARLSIASAPSRLRKGAGRYPQPVALLARLGVDTAHEGRGLGAALLQDVFARLLELSDDIGCRGLLVHAESDAARAFYLHLVPELEPSPTDDLHLVVLMKDIRKTLLR
ncbi:MAG: GNAT family N-acetyltransferase [Acidimicrobiales bacterium]